MSLRWANKPVYLIKADFPCAICEILRRHRPNCPITSSSFQMKSICNTAVRIELSSAMPALWIWILRTAERLERNKQKQAIRVMVSRNSMPANDSVGRLFRFLGISVFFVRPRIFTALWVLWLECRQFRSRNGNKLSAISCRSFLWVAGSRKCRHRCCCWVCACWHRFARR